MICKCNGIGICLECRITKDKIQNLKVGTNKSKFVWNNNKFIFSVDTTGLSSSEDVVWELLLVSINDECPVEKLKIMDSNLLMSSKNFDDIKEEIDRFMKYYGGEI